MATKSTFSDVKALIFKVECFLQLVKNMIAYEEAFQERIDFIEILKEIEFFLEDELRKLKELEKAEELNKDQHQYGDE